MVPGTPRRGAGLLLLFTALALAWVLPSSASAAAYDPFFAPSAAMQDFGAGTRVFGVATADFDGDGKADVATGRIAGGAGTIAVQKGNGDGTLGAPVAFSGRVTTFNAWTLTAADVDGDGKQDLVWGTNQLPNSGCTVSPVPSTGCPATVAVNQGEVRYFKGNGDGTFQEGNYFVSGVKYAGGTLLKRTMTPTTPAASTQGVGSIATADVDGDGDLDLVVGGVENSTSVVRLLRNGGDGSYAMTTLVSETTATTATPPGTTVYWPSINPASSPWGLAFGDADGDGDKDLWVGDRSLYVYLYKNDGTGSFTITPGDTVVSGTRPNAYLAHEGLRASTGLTPSLASSDLNGDGKADLVLGLQSGGQTPATGTPHDGEIALDVSSGSGHRLFGTIEDVGTIARGVRTADLNGDGQRDIVAGEYDGKVKVLRQLPPVDTDADGLSDYVDNAPQHANAPRIDMNADGGLTFLDQLDNDFDTLLGKPEDQSTWQRLGDPADSDDDNDGVADGTDNCKLTGNAGQADGDGDGMGDACDPLANHDSDGDGVPTGPMPGADGYDEALAAAKRWSTGTTHFVIRIDALGRFFQNEFTQLMTDAATLSPAAWQAKCGEDYQPEVEKSDPADPCFTAPDPSTVTLDGGKDVPATLVVIPKQLWSDAPIVAWINDRNDSPNLEIGQHGTYHTDNTGVSDWKDLSDRNFFSCEPCGLSEAENYELLRIGKDTLLGNYDEKWVKESGATGLSPKIDWSAGATAHRLLSFAPPFNTSDTAGRSAVAQLGFKAFSASVFEESGTYGPIFSPEGGHHEAFDQFGMFHASADAEVDPPDILAGAYDHDAYAAELAAQTQPGGLNTWLIEEVEWGHRECNEQDRLTACNGHLNREDNTVDPARWQAWMQLLDHVKNYPGGVVMTMDDVALAKAFDNAPTVPNGAQADADHDGVGDVIDGAQLDAATASLVRNQAGALKATLTNGAGEPIAGQTLVFHYDRDGDGTEEELNAVTNDSGVASAAVTPTRGVTADAGYTVGWDGRRATASDTGTTSVTDSTSLDLDATNPTSGTIGEGVTIGATLTDSDGAPLADRTVTFAVGSATAVGTTDGTGHAQAVVTLEPPAGSQTVSATFTGGTAYAGSSDSGSLQAKKLGTNLLFDSGTVTSGQVTDAVTLGATLTDTTSGPLAGRQVTFSIGSSLTKTATTDAQGHASATFTLDAPAGARTAKVEYAGTDALDPASDSKAFTVAKETTAMTLSDAVSPKKGGSAKATAALKEDGKPVAGKVVRFLALVSGSYKQQGTATTDSTGTAVFYYPAKLVTTTKLPIRAVFDGDTGFLASQADAFTYRQR